MQIEIDREKLFALGLAFFIGMLAADLLAQTHRQQIIVVRGADDDRNTGE